MAYPALKQADFWATYYIILPWLVATYDEWIVFIRNRNTRGPNPSRERWVQARRCLSFVVASNDSVCLDWLKTHVCYSDEVGTYALDEDIFPIPESLRKDHKKKNEFLRCIVFWFNAVRDKSLVLEMA